LWSRFRTWYTISFHILIQSYFVLNRTLHMIVSLYTAVWNPLVIFRIYHCSILEIDSISSLEIDHNFLIKTAPPTSRSSKSRKKKSNELHASSQLPISLIISPLKLYSTPSLFLPLIFPTQVSYVVPPYVVETTAIISRRSLCCLRTSNAASLVITRRFAHLRFTSSSALTSAHLPSISQIL